MYVEALQWTHPPSKESKINYESRHARMCSQLQFKEVKGEEGKEEYLKYSSSVYNVLCSLCLLMDFPTQGITSFNTVLCWIMISVLQ